MLHMKFRALAFSDPLHYAKGLSGINKLQSEIFRKRFKVQKIWLNLFFFYISEQYLLHVGKWRAGAYN
jgi:hypothetical protein